ncbi:MAG: MurR/RpiR family transcriptional regulator [Christensenellales bacterium]|jgi:DNA-binding MurR/RpiR family transcriptional regulator
MEPDLLTRLENRFKTMSKGQKLIARFILSDYDKAAFMTANKLGERVGVSESTVVRFADALGYDGYPYLQKALQELIRHKLTSVQRMEITSDLSQSQVVSKVMKSDINNIRDSLEQMDQAAFQGFIEKMLSADSVYVLGLRSSAPLAQFLAYYLNFLRPNIRSVNARYSAVLEELVHVNDKDVLVALSFPRYSNTTIEAVRFVKESGAGVLAITDSGISPIAEYADHVITAKSDMASFVDSMVAPMSLINALIVALSLYKKNEVATHLGRLEEIWGRHNVYLKKETELNN